MILSEPIEALNPDGTPAQGAAVATAKHFRKAFILEAATEGQMWMKFAPATVQVDPGDEHFIEHGVLKRGTQELITVWIGTRRKAQTQAASDGLDVLSRSNLEVKAAQVGVTVTPQQSKAQIVEAIRAKK